MTAHKLTKNQIEVLRKALVSGKVKSKDLAKRFGITEPAVSWHRAQLIKAGLIVASEKDEDINGTKRADCL
jgi:DNA-binding MarR family transcriptional regulator